MLFIRVPSIIPVWYANREQKTMEKYNKLVRRLKKANKEFDYDYTRMSYGSRSDKVEVVCNEHGAFTKSVQQLERGLGCPTCIKSERRKKAKQAFINKATYTHGARYSYDKVDYKTNKDLVIITCNEHGDFEQSPDNHMSGHGCKKCQYEEVSNKNKMTLETFVERAKEVHGNVYDYSLVDYVNSTTKVKILLDSGEVVEQLPSHHLQGFRPSSCNTGLNYKGPGILYYLKITLPDTVVYKIGITSKTVETRFRPNDLSIIEVINVESFDTLRKAYDKEQHILKTYKDYRYTGPDILISGGNTELFTVDVLGLGKGDTNEIDTVGQ